MKNAFLSKTILSQATPVLGAVALSAIALVGMPQSAKADDTCGPGNDWVNECEAGVDVFPQSWAILDLWLVNPDKSMGKTIQLMLSGPATVTREAGKDGVIKTKLEEKFTGQGFTVTGIGTGEIQQDTNNDKLASSFFDVFATIDGPFGKARNMNPIRVYGDRWLLGVSPDQIPGQLPPPPLPVPFTSAQAAECTQSDPLAAIIYCGFDSVDFFTAGDDNIFGNGDDIKVAVLHSEKHIVHTPIPEPSTAAASIFVGLGAMFGLKRKQQSNKS